MGIKYKMGQNDMFLYKKKKRKKGQRLLFCIIKDKNID